MYIINLQTSSINRVYDSFNDFFKAVNTYIATEEFIFVIKYSKKSKKKILRKVWPECDKSKSYKAKRYWVQQTSTMKNEYLYEIIATTCRSEQNI